MSDQTGADFVSGATVRHWTKRKAIMVVAAAWAAPALLTLATLIGVYFAIDGLMPLWSDMARGLFQLLGATAAISIVHLAAAFALGRALGHRIPEPDSQPMEIAPFRAVFLGLVAPYGACFVIAKLFGKPYVFALAVALLWGSVHDRQASPHLGRLLRTKAPTLWPANNEEAARLRKRREDRAGHALAAYFLLMPLAAAVAIVVIALLRD